MTLRTDREVAPVATETVADHPSAMARIGQILILVAGAIMLVSGALTLIRTSFDGDFTSPTVQVFGYQHEPWLGFAEILVGLLLVAGGASAWNREMALVLGVLLVVVGAVVAAEPNALPDRFDLEGSYGWFLIGIGVLAGIGGLLPGGWITTRRARRDGVVR